MEKKQTGEEVECLRLALAICGIGISSKTACLINEVVKESIKMGDKFSVWDAMRIKSDVEKRYTVTEVVAKPTNP